MFWYSIIKFLCFVYFEKIFSILQNIILEKKVFGLKYLKIDGFKACLHIFSPLLFYFFYIVMLASKFFVSLLSDYCFTIHYQNILVEVLKLLCIVLSYYLLFSSHLKSPVQYKQLIYPNIMLHFFIKQKRLFRQ